MTHLGFCRRKGCGEPLVDRMDNLGRLVVGCEACARNKRGLCADCPNHLERTRALRCNRCAKARDLALDRAAKKRKYRTVEAFRQHQLDYHREKRRDPTFLKREAERWSERRKRKPRVRTDLDRHVERIRRKMKPLSREAKDRHNAARRQRYATDMEYRARKLASASKQRSGKRKPLTPDQRRRRNDHMRERYERDQAWREKRQARARDYDHRVRRPRTAAERATEQLAAPIADVSTNEARRAS